MYIAGKVRHRVPREEQHSDVGRQRRDVSSHSVPSSERMTISAAAAPSATPDAKPSAGSASNTCCTAAVSSRAAGGWRIRPSSVAGCARRRGAPRLWSRVPHSGTRQPRQLPLHPGCPTSAEGRGHTRAPRSTRSDGVSAGWRQRARPGRSATWRNNRGKRFPGKGGGLPSTV